MASRYYIQGETMESIAHQLKLSRLSISRLLKDARETGLVRISLADHSGSQSPAAATLSRLFGVRVHMVSVRRAPREPSLRPGRPACRTSAHRGGRRPHVHRGGLGGHARTW